MQYTSLVFNLLPNLFWSITPALPRGAGGTRLEVGTAEVIPDFTFVARDMTVADGFPVAEVNRLNGFIRQGRAMHTTYGLAPRSVACLDDILRQFEPSATPVERIRLISHGDQSFVFLPVFRNGRWDYGMQEDRLQAFQDRDEAGLRFLIGGPLQAPPLLPDAVDDIATGQRARNAGLLAPFGLDGAGAPAGVVREYFGVVNDLFQVPNGTVMSAPAMLVTAAQRATLTTSLNLIEAELRRGLVGTTPPGAPAALTDNQLKALRDAVLAATPAQLGLMGAQRNLAAGAVAATQTALAAVPRVEDDLRTAITGVIQIPTLAGINYSPAVLSAVNVFAPAALRLAGAPRTPANIMADARLADFVASAVDLHHFRNVGVLINGVAPTAAERTTIHDGLMAISTIIRNEIAARAVDPIPAADLNALRNAIDNRPVRESMLSGWIPLPAETFGELTAANTALASGFRNRLIHFRGLMKPGDASKLDIRGCLVGAAPAFLDVVRDFLGGAANKPTVSAPDWFQSFPSGGFTWSTGNSIFGSIDTSAAERCTSGQRRRRCGQPGRVARPHRFRSALPVHQGFVQPSRDSARFRVAGLAAVALGRGAQRYSAAAHGGGAHRRPGHPQPG